MSSYLLLFDFDGTMFDTFKPGPEGINVKQASERAIKDVFGDYTSLAFSKDTSLHNHAPYELVRHLSLNGFDSSMSNTVNNFLRSNRDEIDSLVPGGKGYDLRHNDRITIELMTEIFVRQKLKYLKAQIGKKTDDDAIWPQPATGFLDFWKVIERLSPKDTFKTGIVSSGHETFIRKVFETWSLKQPEIIITEDDIRGRKNPPTYIERESRRRYKPGLLPFALAHREWLKREGKTGFSFSPTESQISRNRIVYFGDDYKKDGEMAYAANVVFGHYNPNRSSYIIKSENYFEFGDWRAISGKLTEKKQNMNEGMPFSSIFLREKDHFEFTERPHMPEVQSRSGKKETQY